MSARSAPDRPARTLDPAAKLEALQDAALRLFAEHGFHGTTTDMIARAAGVGAGTLYRFVASKDELVLRVYARVKEAAGALVMPVGAGEGPPEAALRGLWMRTARALLDHPVEFFFLEQFYGSPYVRQVPAEARARFAAPVDAVVARASSAGVVRALDPAAFEALFFAPAMALARMHHLGLAVADDALLATTLDGCMKAVGP
jgi:AcrR family transcriptional regulator